MGIVGVPNKALRGHILAACSPLIDSERPCSAQLPLRAMSCAARCSLRRRACGKLGEAVPSPITKIREGKFERAHCLGPRLGPSLALPGMQSASMQSYKLTFETVKRQNDKPILERQKFVTAHTDGKDMLAAIVSVFAEGHEAVRLVSSDGNNVEIDLVETVRGLQAGDDVPGISQDRAARTGLILVGPPQRPIQKHHGVISGPSTAMLLPGPPIPPAYKRGRMQSSDPEKTKLGQKTAGQLPLKAQNLLHSWMRSLCSREAEPPWLFRAYDEQRLAGLVIGRLLRRDELAGKTYGTVEKHMKT